MGEREESYNCIEKIVNAVQRMRECLVCRICLELFKEPVTIKCGHKFCKKCILQVTKNKHATCPFCNIKIDKRSIPSKENELLESTIKLFNNLKEAIYNDSGINVLQPYINVKHTKESIPDNELSSTFKPESISSFSKESSSNAKLSKLTISNNNGKKYNSKRKQVISRRKLRNNNNTLCSYLSKDSDSVPNQPVHTEEKVKSWLQNIPQTVNNIENLGEDFIEEPIDELLINKVNSASITVPSSKELKDLNSIGTSEPSLAAEQKFKGIEKLENNAKSDKSNPNLPENSNLQGAISTPVTLHSDANNWRRIKQVEKDMQIKKFKSLRVSIEKSYSSILLDDTVPCNSTFTNSKSISKSTDLKNSPNSLSVSERNSSNINNTLQQNGNIGNVKCADTSKYPSMDSSDSNRQEPISLSYIDESKVNEIIGFSKLQATPEVARNATNIDLVRKLSTLSPLKENFDNKHESSEFLQSATSNTDYKTDITNAENSPSKLKLTLKMKLPTWKSSPSQSSNTPVKNKLSTNLTPEKIKKKSSCQLPVVKCTELELNEASLENRMKINDFARSHRTITFKKLGKIARKQKNIAFFCLGKLQPKKRVIICSPTKDRTSGIKIKSNEPANIEYNFLTANASVNANSNESSMIITNEPVNATVLSMVNGRQSILLSNKLIGQSDNKVTHAERHDSIINETNVPMEIDNVVPSGKMPSELLDSKESVIQENDYVNVDKQNVNCRSRAYPKKSGKAENQATGLNFENIEKCETANNDRNSFEHKSHLKRGSDERRGARDSSEKDDRKMESNADSQVSMTRAVDCQENVENDESVRTSRSSSLLKASQLKKKRKHSESSNDEDVSNIIGKWYENGKEQKIKKQKITTSDGEIEENDNKVDSAVDDLSCDDDDNALSNETIKKGIANENEDEAVGKAQSFKENTDGTNKLFDIPSSLLSTDLFESNDHYVQSSVKPCFKSLNKVSSMSNRVRNRTYGRTIDREEGVNEHFAGKSNISECSESSNKENNTCNIDVNNSSIKENLDNVDRASEINSSLNRRSMTIKNDSNNESPYNIYQVPESLMNITQEQLAMKKIEKALIGVNLSEINIEKNEGIQDKVMSTPTHKFNYRANTNDEDFESESIDATPISRKKQIFNFQTPKSRPRSDTNGSCMSSPCIDKSLNLISAVTPMKYTRSYPLSHSTPMIDIQDGKNKSVDKRKTMTLICSGLPMESIKVVRTFTEQFGAVFQNNFSMAVTHVIVQTNPTTKAAQKTFKYIQGIAYRKYVMNFQWIIDCLKQSSLLDENENKYEVLDPDIFECGSKKSRFRIEDLFVGFAFFLQGPFNSFQLDDFKSIIEHNGGLVAPSLKDLALQSEKHKIVILESENLSSNEISSLKASKGILISFEWIVDSISQYQILSLLTYLCETSTEEALALGFPPEYFVDEETLDEEDE